MRAKKIHESMDFQRGGDPKESIGIGLKNMIWNEFRSIMKGGKGAPIPQRIWVKGGNLLLKTFYRKAWIIELLRSTGISQYIELPGKSISPGGSPEKIIRFRVKPQYRDLLDGMDSKEFRREIGESVNFERGVDPKSSMGIGIFKDKSGIPIRIGSDVLGATEDGFYFSGIVKEFTKDGTILVKDDQWEDPVEVKPSEIEVITEALSFQRGREPKKSMGIGLAARRIEVYEELEKALNDEFPSFIHNDIVDINDWNPLGIPFKYVRKSILVRGPMLHGENAKKVLNRWMKKYFPDFRVTSLQDVGRFPGSTYNMTISWKHDNLTESVSFERGRDPKRAMSVGHAEIYPEKTLFLDIYKYCEEDKFPGFQRLTPIYWDEDPDGHMLVEPYFRAFVNDGSKDPRDKNFYTVYLTRTEGVVSFHEYEDYEGYWKEQEHLISHYDFWRRLMEANHIRTIFKDTKELQEAQFVRGRDPKRAMDIGLSARQIYDNLSPGDIFITLVDMPGIQIPKDLYVLVLGVVNEGYNQKGVKYASSENLDSLKKNYNKLGFNYWGWPFDFFKECLEKVDRIEIDPQE